MFSEFKYTKYLVRIQKCHDFFGFDSEEVMTFSEFACLAGMVATELTVSPGDAPPSTVFFTRLLPLLFCRGDN